MSLLLSFPFVKDGLRLVVYLLVGFVFIGLSIVHAGNKGFTVLSEVIKFLLCFINLTSLIYLLEHASKAVYFKSILSTIYGPFFNKGVNTNIFFLAIFIVTSILLLGFKRLNVGEEDGK